MTYMNLCLILKYAYTGHVEMAENRVKGFLDAAKSLGMIGLVDDEETTKKSRKRKKKSSSESAKQAKLEAPDQKDSAPPPTVDNKPPAHLDSDTSSCSMEAPRRRSLLADYRKRKLAKDNDKDQLMTPNFKRIKNVSFTVNTSCCQYCFQPCSPDAKGQSHELNCDKRSIEGGEPSRVG